MLYNLVLFAILMMGASYLIGQLTAGQDVKIIKDLGLAATSVFGLFIAVFIGIGLVSKEVERRSIYSLLAKPIHRHHLILGKYLGLALTLLVNVAIMTFALYVVLLYMKWGVDPVAQRGWDAPALDPAPAAGGGAHLRRTARRDGNRAVLLDVLDAAPLRRVDLRPRRRRSLQQRPPQLSGCRGIVVRAVDRARGVLGPAEPRAVRRQVAGRARADRAGALHRDGHRLRAAVRRRCCSSIAGFVFSRRDFK